MLVPPSTRLEPVESDHDVWGWTLVWVVGLTSCFAAWGALVMGQQLAQRLEDRPYVTWALHQRNRLDEMQRRTEVDAALTDQLTGLAAHLGVQLVQEPAMSTPARWVVRAVEADPCATQSDPQRCREAITLLEQTYGEQP